MSHVYGLLRHSGPEGATEFKTLPVEISNSLGSAADEATRAMPDFEHAYVLSRLCRSDKTDMAVDGHRTL
jgi:hypothetical protein